MLADSTYCEHWQLNHAPFRGDLGADAYYEGSSHTESLARLQYLVDEGRRLGLVVGARGMGKSLLLDIFARQLRDKRHRVAHVDALGMSARELLWDLLVGLGANPGGDDDRPRLWRRLVDRLREHRLQELSTVILLDDLADPGPDVMTTVARLARLDAGHESRLTIAAVAETGQVGRLSSALVDLIDLKTELRPWEEAETIGYVQMALVDAGREVPLFDASALDAIHALSGGVPRRINRLAEAALIAAAAAGKDAIDAEAVKNVDRELS